MTTAEKALLTMLRAGIGHGACSSTEEGLDWNVLYQLSQRSGVAPIVADYIERCLKEEIPLDIDRFTKLKFVATAQMAEQRYEKQLAVMKSLAAFYRKHDIRMVVLKGYGLSRNFPKPEHRLCSDIDIYLDGKQKKGDELIEQELGIKIDRSHHHHTVFRYKKETIENHYDFLNVYVHRVNRKVERKLKEICTQGMTEDHGYYLPSADFDAIFVLQYCSNNFSSTGISLRQVLDWGFLMKRRHQEITWDEYLPFLKEHGMYQYYNLLSQFCVKFLGFDTAIFKGLYDDPLFDRFSDNVLSPEFKDKENGHLLHSLSVKPRRWWHNRWKNKLCYPDSIASNFISAVWQS